MSKIRHGNKSCYATGGAVKGDKAPAFDAGNKDVAKEAKGTTIGKIDGGKAKGRADRPFKGK